MGWKTLGSADDAARAMLTHRCRHRPGLKLRPEHCETYRNNRNPASTSTQYLLCNQWECPGAVPIQVEIEKPAKEAEVRNRNKPYKEPDTCRICGLRPGDCRPDNTEVTFFPSRPDMCKKCIKDREYQVRGEKFKLKVQPVQNESETYHCEIHGEHKGVKQGSKWMPLCPKCIQERRSEGLRRYAEKSRNTARIVDSIPFLLPWLEEQVIERKLDCDAYEFMGRLIAEQIPAEWVKRWIINGGMK